MLNRGEQTLTAVTGSGGRLHFGMVAGIKSERWPTSNRNPRPDCVGIRNFTVHGFRTSFRTWCSDVAHAEFEVAEQCLSHRVGNDVSRSYNRTSMLERRRPIMTAWANFVCAADARNVITLHAHEHA